jgi:hypothetical protein
MGQPVERDEMSELGTVAERFKPEAAIESGTPFLTKFGQIVHSIYRQAAPMRQASAWAGIFPYREIPTKNRLFFDVFRQSQWRNLF